MLLATQLSFPPLPLTLSTKLKIKLATKFATEIPSPPRVEATLDIDSGNSLRKNSVCPTTPDASANPSMIWRGNSHNADMFTTASG